jgi:hypothetical protein
LGGGLGTVFPTEGDSVFLSDGLGGSVGAIPDGIYTDSLGDPHVVFGGLVFAPNENGDTNLAEIASGNTAQGDVSGLWYQAGVLLDGLDWTYVASPSGDFYFISGVPVYTPAPGSPVWDGTYFFLANGWVTNLPESGTGYDLYNTGVFCVSGWVATSNADASDALTNVGTGTWDGYDSYQGPTHPELAGIYLNGKLVIHHIAVSGASDPLANGDYFEIVPAMGEDRSFENSNGYLLERWVGSGSYAWFLYDPLAVYSGTAAFGSAIEVPFIPDGVTFINITPNPTLVTHFTAGASADILISGFPSSTTIFGAGLLAA